MTKRVSLKELLAWRDEETAQWKDFFVRTPRALELPCDIAGAKDVRGLVQHILAVELRYAERLNDVTQPTPYEEMDITTTEKLFSHGDRAVQLLSAFLAKADDSEMERVIEFATRSAGTLKASKRKCFIHAMLHGVRHWAQLAVLLRQSGMKTDWQHDFLTTRTMP